MDFNTKCLTWHPELRPVSGDGKGQSEESGPPVFETSGTRERDRARSGVRIRTMAANLERPKR
jgi:hypothetical protein